MNLEKPSKQKRKAQANALLKEVMQYRMANKILAAERDGGLCVVCFFKFGKRIGASDVHHVYGRAPTKRVLESPKESFRSLMCLCRTHHDEVGVINTTGSSWAWVIDYLNMANNTPINKDFVYDDSN